jgi:hypothetical protein
MQDKHIREIIELLKKCTDPVLLDFIYQLLRKHQTQV